jgi:hypothetical protein
MLGVIVFAVFLAAAILCLTGSIVALLLLRPLLAILLFAGFVVFALLAIGWLILWIIFRALARI